MARFTTHQGAPASCPGYAAERSEATQCGFLQTWPSEAHGLRNGAHRPGIWEFAVLALRLHIRIVKRNLLCILIFPKAWNMKQVQTVVYLIYSFYILIDIGYKVLEIVFYHFFVNWGGPWTWNTGSNHLGQWQVLRPDFEWGVHSTKLPSRKSSICCAWSGASKTICTSVQQTRSRASICQKRLLNETSYWHNKLVIVVGVRSWPKCCDGKMEGAVIHICSHLLETLTAW